MATLAHYETDGEVPGKAGVGQPTVVALILRNTANFTLQLHLFNFLD